MCRKTGFINRAFTILRALDTRVTFADSTHASKGWVSSDPFEKMFHFEANGPNCSVFDDKCRRLYLIFFYLQVIGTFKDIGPLAALASQSQITLGILGGRNYSSHVASL